jgi:hypothetical protein
MPLIQYIVLDSHVRAQKVSRDSDHFSFIFSYLRLNSHVKLFDHRFQNSLSLYAYGLWTRVVELLYKEIIPPNTEIPSSAVS